MAKATTLILLALIAISMLANVVSATHKSYYYKGKNYGPGTVKLGDCNTRCKERCSNTQYYNACMEFCPYCCKRCLCVPPGTFGNKQVCPCYNNMKTHEGGPKCP